MPPFYPFGIKKKIMAEKKKKYKCLVHMVLSQKTWAPGDLIELTDKQAKEWIASGQVKQARATKPVDRAEKRG